MVLMVRLCRAIPLALRTAGAGARDIVGRLGGGEF